MESALWRVLCGECFVESALWRVLCGECFVEIEKILESIETC